jgi:flavin reductase (DIM6/NTAB) family NADH-FMN oxidoreductase RutF
MVINYADKALTQKYQLMAQTIIPRPIAWVLTQNEDGSTNIAPFSYFMGLSSEPPTMVVSIGHKSDGTQKDTLKNLRERKKCTICMIDEPLLEKMHFSSKELENNISETELFSIPTKKVEEDFPPMVEGAPSAFFCTLYQEIDLKGSKTIPMVVEIQHQYIDDKIITDTERITLDYEPVARVGKSYALLGKKITPPAIP